MFTEDYVSFETAKLLKEKGFDGSCYKVWAKESKSEPKLYAAPNFVEGESVVNRESVEDGERFMNDFNQSEYKIEGYLAPTLQMAMKWLREVHHLQICIASYSYAWEEYIHGWQFVIKKLIFTEGVGWNWDDSFDAIIDRTMSDNTTYETYEETCQAAIKHCLEKLI